MTDQRREMVPLRDLIDAHHQEVKDRLDKIDKNVSSLERRVETNRETTNSKIDRNYEHNHSDKVSWAALLPLLITLGGALVYVFQQIVENS